MITKELFNECMQAFKEYSEWEGKLYDLGINLSESFEMSNLILTFNNLLAYCCEEQYTEDNCELPNLIDYFMYDLNFGAFAKGNNSEPETVEELWEAITAAHPDVPDCCDKQKVYSDEEVIDAIMEAQDEI